MTQVEITKYKSSEGLISNQQGELRRKVNLLRRFKLFEQSITK